MLWATDGTPAKRLDGLPCIICTTKLHLREFSAAYQQIAWDMYLQTAGCAIDVPFTSRSRHISTESTLGRVQEAQIRNTLGLCLASSYLGLISVYQVVGVESPGLACTLRLLGSEMCYRLKGSVSQSLLVEIQYSNTFTMLYFFFFFFLFFFGRESMLEQSRYTTSRAISRSGSSTCSKSRAVN